MEVKWKRGFDKSDVTENNSISLAQFDYMVRFQEEYIEEIAAGQNMFYRGFFFLTFNFRRIPGSNYDDSFEEENSISSSSGERISASMDGKCKSSDKYAKYRY